MSLANALNLGKSKILRTVHKSTDDWIISILTLQQKIVLNIWMKEDIVTTVPFFVQYLFVQDCLCFIEESFLFFEYLFNPSPDNPDLKQP